MLLRDEHFWNCKAWSAEPKIYSEKEFRMWKGEISSTNPATLNSTPVVRKLWFSSRNLKPTAINQMKKPYHESYPAASLLSTVTFSFRFFQVRCSRRLEILPIVPTFSILLPCWKPIVWMIQSQFKINQCLLNIWTKSIWISPKWWLENIKTGRHCQWIRLLLGRIGEYANYRMSLTTFHWLTSQRFGKRRWGVWVF